VFSLLLGSCPTNAFLRNWMRAGARAFRIRHLHRFWKGVYIQTGIVRNGG